MLDHGNIHIFLCKSSGKWSHIAGIGNISSLLLAVWFTKPIIVMIIIAFVSIAIGVDTKERRYEADMSILSALPVLFTGAS